MVGWCQDSAFFVRNFARKSANKVQGLDMQEPIDHMATTWLNPEILRRHCESQATSLELPPEVLNGYRTEGLNSRPVWVFAISHTKSGGISRDGLKRSSGFNQKLRSSSPAYVVDVRRHR